ncbi:MAG: hypothetical protein JWN30_2623 [Bacilli bacterium]|nr:hypothetical protein [Bacilli bacterium]
MNARRGNATKKYQRITDEIVHYIRSGDLQPGDKLPSLADMAYEFGVSRAAMREAFSALQGMGLVSMRHGEGTFVASVNMKTDIVEPMNAALLLGLNDLQYLHEVRTILETTAAALAAQRRTEQQLDELTAAIWKLECGGLELKEMVSMDWQIHLTVAEAAANPVLLNLLSTLSASMQSVTMLVLSATDANSSVVYYWNIFDAIKRQSPVVAQSAMAEYLDVTWNSVVQFKK